MILLAADTQQDPDRHSKDCSLAFRRPRRCGAEAALCAHAPQIRMLYNDFSAGRFVPVTESP